MKHDNSSVAKRVEHTPGPWAAYHSLGAGWCVQTSEPPEGRDSKSPICSMAWFQFSIPGVIDDEISAANANLIAAAPDLLEALELAVATIDRLGVQRGPFKSGQGALDVALAAIAKARGQ